MKVCICIIEICLKIRLSGTKTAIRSRRLDFRDGTIRADLGLLRDVNLFPVVFDTHVAIRSSFLRFSSARAFVEGKSKDEVLAELR